MYTSSTLFLTAIVALVRVAAATPPACLIAAMGAQPNPADLKALCGTLEPQVVGNITEKCSGSAQAAFSVYSATCLASESVTITMTSSSSSSSQTGSVSATTTATGSGSSKPTAGGSTSASKTIASASGTAKPTGSSTETSSSSTASSTATGGSSLTSPQIASFVAPFILAAGLASQYLL